MVIFHSYVSLPEGIRIIHSCSCQIKYVLHAQTRMGDHFQDPTQIWLVNSLQAIPSDHLQIKLRLVPHKIKVLSLNKDFPRLKCAIKCYKYMTIYSFHVKFKRFFTKKMAQAIWPALHGWRRRIFFRTHEGTGTTTKVTER